MYTTVSLLLSFRCNIAFFPDLVPTYNPQMPPVP